MSPTPQTRNPSSPNPPSKANRHQATNSSEEEPANSSLRHNFIVLTFFHVTLRLGWIFKTESIVIPAVLDSIGGTATLRGLLPMLSRFGMAIPPVIAAPFIRRAAKKKTMLARFSILMGICFLVLASLWLLPKQQLGVAFPYIFLTIYTVFFICSGLNVLSFGTLQGKVIPTTLRGRLMLAANVVGATVAITAAFLLMPRWLNEAGGQFQYVFGFTGACFVIAGLLVLWTREKSDAANEKEDASHSKKRDGFIRVYSALAEDRDLRRVALMSALAGCSIMLYPHYQALARDRLQASLASLMIWVAVQNFGTALFSSFAGWFADRLGNKVVLHAIVGGLAFIPLFALALSRSNAPPAAFACVFFFIGLTPVFMRIVQHYVLELASAKDHPRYLAAVAICNALPFLLSGAVGYCVDLFGYEVVFLVITVIITVAFGLTFRLNEPRDSAA